MIRGKVEELSDGFLLDSPYLVDKGPARGTILEGRDDLIVSRVGKLSTTFGESTNVVMETLAFLFLAMA
jgi:hypothetical protein